MKYKKQLMGSMLALTIIVSGSSAFAADIHPATTTKAHMFRNQVKMKSGENDDKVDLKDVHGKDIETNDDATTTLQATSTRSHLESHKKTTTKFTTGKKVNRMKLHKYNEDKTASSTRNM